MKPNFEGFIMPHIDKDKCIDCGLCEKKCAYLNPINLGVKISQSYCGAVYRIDESERMHSASGGIISTIVENFIAEGGIAIGCGWTDHLVAKHIMVKDIEEAKKLRSSKYVQSDIHDAYHYINKALSASKKVVFIGTPCQVGAIRNIFGNTEKLYLIGLICGGVASPKVWNSFMTAMEKKYKSKMLHVNFKSKKRYGWSSPIASYEFENGKKSEKLAYQLDDYVVQYLYGVFKRKSCFQCGYKSDSINADLVCGDYWGSPELRARSNNKGVSAFLCLTEKGKECINLVRSECQVLTTTYESIVKNNLPLIQPVKGMGDRDKFFSMLDEEGYITAIQKYGVKPNPIKYELFKLLDMLGIFEFVKQKAQIKGKY